MNALDAIRGFAPARSWRDAGEQEHFVQFYEHESELLRPLADFLKHGLDTGAGAVVIATAAHLEQLERELRARGVEAAALRQ